MKKFKYSNEGYGIIEVPKEIVDIITYALGVDDDDVKMDTNFVNDLGCDSLDCVELIIKVEKEYGISITDDEAMKCHTVEDLIKLIYEINKR